MIWRDMFGCYWFRDPGTGQPTGRVRLPDDRPYCDDTKGRPQFISQSGHE